MTLHINSRQNIIEPLLIHLESKKHFSKASATELGAVFTRREVVDFILDLAGYTKEHSLQKYHLLEPSFGNGDFLLPAVDRLLTIYNASVEGHSNIIEDLKDAVRAFEVNQNSIEEAKCRLFKLFQTHKISKKFANALLSIWLIEGDFLLEDLPFKFSHVVGNPPYVRQELITTELLIEYRNRYQTMYDRADLYVPFIERSLASLETNGTLAFICADRWMKNKYGGPLRSFVAASYHLKFYIDMVDTPAFHSEVIAYPAITIITREKSGPTRIAHRPKINKADLTALAKSIQSGNFAKDNSIIEVSSVVKTHEPWILHSFDQLAVVRRLESDFPAIEEAGCKIGIGVATGADKVFIDSFDRLDVEPDRKLPLVKTKDIEGGIVEWKGLGVINPFLNDGTLVNLSEYPKLARHFQKHADVILKRNCAKKYPKGWYRTIDRINPEILNRPKLLIPDIKGEAHIVYEAGHFYPHHNLYFITSEEWDLKALQAVLRSGIAKLFVSIYSTQMRGGYLRFQAQYLRRIRLPKWKNVPEQIRKALMKAAHAGDVEKCNRTVFDLYGLTPKELDAIGG